MQIARRFSRFTDSSECNFSDFSISVSVRTSNRPMLLLPTSRTVAPSYSFSEAHSSCGPKELKFGGCVRTVGTVKTAYAFSSLNSIAITSTWILSTDKVMIPARNEIKRACVKFYGKWRVSTIHPERIRTVHSLTTRSSKCLNVFSLCVAAQRDRDRVVGTETGNGLEGPGQGILSSL